MARKDQTIAIGVREKCFTEREMWQLVDTLAAPEASTPEARQLRREWLAHAGGCQECYDQLCVMIRVRDAANRAKEKVLRGVRATRN